VFIEENVYLISPDDSMPVFIMKVDSHLIVVKVPNVVVLVFLMYELAPGFKV
jgi:hypothetical protein